MTKMYLPPQNVSLNKQNGFIEFYIHTGRICMCDRNYKRYMEYLFYAHDPERSCESDKILHIAETGFKTADAYKVPNTSQASEEWI